MTTYEGRISTSTRAMACFGCWKETCKLKPHRKNGKTASAASSLASTPHILTLCFWLHVVLIWMLLLRHGKTASAASCLSRPPPSSPSACGYNDFLTGMLILKQWQVSKCGLPSPYPSLFHPPLMATFDFNLRVSFTGVARQRVRLSLPTPPVDVAA